MTRTTCGFLAVLSGLLLAGCTTEKTRTIREGEVTEDTAGIAEQDIRFLVKRVVTDIDGASARYAKPGARRVVAVREVVIDTTSRGAQAGYLAETLAQCFQEELADGGRFVIYNEKMAQANAAVGRLSTTAPEFVLTSSLREQNVRRDNGNYYKEYSLLIRLTDVASNLDIWQKRVPIQKAVDKDNVL